MRANPEFEAGWNLLGFVCAARYRGAGKVRMQVVWKPGSLQPRLEEADVHVWRFPLSTTVTPALSADEAVRAARFALPHHRQAFETRRTLLRMLLASYQDCGPLDFELLYGADGRPEVAPQAGGGPALRFSSSNTEEWLLIGVTLSADIGVDIERSDVNRDYDGLARECFSEREMTVYCACNDDEKASAFIKAWTQKEAFVKAIGRGITYPLRDVEVSVAPGEAGGLIGVDPDDSVSDWSLTCFEPAEAHMAAAAVALPSIRLSYFAWPGEASL
jgi:4'-phosphopantetheinyl transferase